MDDLGAVFPPLSRIGRTSERCAICGKRKTSDDRPSFVPPFLSLPRRWENPPATLWGEALNAPSVMENRLFSPSILLAEVVETNQIAAEKGKG